MIDVKVLVHLEDGVWWAETPQVAGFSAAENSLQDLLARARWALTDIAMEEGLALNEITFDLVPTPPTSGNPEAQQAGGHPDRRHHDTRLAIPTAA